MIAYCYAFAAISASIVVAVGNDNIQSADSAHRNIDKNPMLYLGQAANALRCSAENCNCPMEAPCCNIYGYCSNGEGCLPGLCIARCPGGVREESQMPQAPLPFSQWLKPSSLKTPLIHQWWDENGPIDYETLRGMGNIYSKCVNPYHVTLTYDDGPDR